MIQPPYPDRRFAAFLFDMDGTLLTSIKAAERVWGAWARRHGLDLDAFLPTIHGMRTIDTVRRLQLPGIDAEAEAAGITRDEMIDTGGIEAIGGAAAFLASLPVGRWAVVTSASKALASARLAAAGLPMPPALVSADDVARGKPAPDCFLLAARRLGVAIEDCLVFEDAPAGIAAGEAAGAALVVITATHTHPVPTPHATLADYRGLGWQGDADGRLALGLRG